MLEYDSSTDQYNEIYPSDDESGTDSWDKKSDISIYTTQSFRSSKYSLRSSANISNLIRVVSKTGHFNVFRIKIPKKYAVYFRDLGNTLLNIRWRWIMVTLCLTNGISFLMFGLLFMLVAYVSGDFEENVESLCIVNTRNLTGYILLSIETMLTIGYGYRYPTENCVLGWTVPFLQALVSVGIQGALVSVVYVKITKPFTKNSLGLFSKKAVVCLRDGNLCIGIRIADLTAKISVGTNISMYFIDKTNFEYESIAVNVQQIKVQPHGFLIFPLELIHIIDQESPFWELTPFDLLTKPLEIVVVAEGLSAVTGQISQNRTSYVNSDILWGHRFVSCVNFDNESVNYIVNYKNINKILPFDTPLCSAEELDRLKTTNVVNNCS